MPAYVADATMQAVLAGLRRKLGEKKTREKGMRATCSLNRGGGIEGLLEDVVAFFLARLHFKLVKNCVLHGCVRAPIAQ